MRTNRTIALTAMALALLASCRTTRPEAGLPPTAYQGMFPRVVSNDRGFWFLVTDGKAAQQPFVALGSGAEREVFYAVPVGKRTARLLPLTPFSYQLLDASRDLQRVEALWLDTPDTLGDDLADTVGWMSKASAAPAWAGKVPVDGTPVMLVDGSLETPPTLGEWFLGTATVKGGKLTAVQFDGEPTGSIAVIPDGTAPTRPIRAALAGLSVKAVDGVEYSSMQVAVPDGPASLFTTRPIALRSGVDALVSARTDDTADITLTRPIIREGLALASTENPLVVRRADVSKGLLAFRDVAAGRDLAATRALLSLGVDGAQGAAARMRALEILASAGYVDWVRHELMTGADGLSADVAVYLCRSHFVGRDFERAADFAGRAQDRFVDWSGMAGIHGNAQAMLLSARLAARSGEWNEAFTLAIDAAKQFESAQDSMRAAEAELLAASYATNAQDLTRAVQAAALARSRFFHGKSSYHAAFAELALADIYARAGETAEAAKMTEFAVLRFEKLGDSVGRNRARIAAGLVASGQSRAQAVRDLEIGLEKAQTGGDFVGVVDAAASLVMLGGAPKDATASYGLVIAAGMARTVDPFVRERAAQALTLLCGRGLADTVGGVRGASPRDIAIAKSACSAPSKTQADAGMIGALIGQGWAAWRLGNVDEAAAVARRLEDVADETVRQNAPRQAAQALFFSAVVLRDTELSRSDERAADAMRVLTDHIDPANLAPTLNELATQYVGRGQSWLGADLLRAAQAVAGEQGQAELRREYAMRRVEVLHAAGDYDGVLTAINDAIPVMETAGAPSAALLTRLWVVQADALQRLGRDADAGVAAGKVAQSMGELEPIAKVRLTLLTGQLAAQRGDVEAATAALTRAERLEGALADGLVASDSRQVLRGRIKLARAEAAMAKNSRAEAANACAEALSAVDDLAASHEVLGLRIDANRWLGLSTGSDERLEQTIVALEQLRAATMTDFPTLLPSATAALAALQIEAGRPSRALEVVTASGLDGVAAAENPREAMCIEARAAALSGRSGGHRMLDRCADVSVGDAKADATLLSALLDPAKSASEKNRTARELSAASTAVSPREQERLAYVSELAAGAQKRDEAKEQRLLDALERATTQGPKPIVAAIEKLVEYFASTGQSDRAQPIVDQHSQSFYDLGPEGPGALARIRAEASVGMLEPVAGYAFASRALTETPDIAASDEAGLLYASARNAVLLGIWQGARSDIAKAITAASRNAAMRRRIEAFARRFSLL